MPREQRAVGRGLDGDSSLRARTDLRRAGMVRILRMRTLATSCPGSTQNVTWSSMLVTGGLTLPAKSLDSRKFVLVRPLPEEQARRSNRLVYSHQGLP